MVDSSLEDDLLQAVGHAGSGSASRASHSAARPAGRRARAAASSDSSSAEDDDYRSGDDDDDEDDDDGGSAGSAGRRAAKPGAKGGSRMPLKKRLEAGKGVGPGEARGGGNGDEDGAESEELSFGSDLYIDEEDRERLAKLTELEREMELAERSDRRDAFWTRNRQKQAKKRQQEVQEKKGAAGAVLARSRSAAATAGPSSRQENAFAKLEAAKAAKQQRQQDLDDMARRKREKLHSRGRVDKGESPRRPGDSDAFESESEDDEEARSEEGAAAAAEDSDDDERRKPAPEADLGDVRSILLRRTRLAKWCWEPDFEERVVGCYVRIGIGLNPSGQPMYRLCEITGVDARPSNKQYELEGRRTHKWLDCKWGEHRAGWMIARVSDKDATENEFAELMRELDKAGSARPTKAYVAEKREGLDLAANHVYSAADVKKIVEEKRRAAKGPRNLVVEKDRLEKEMGAAKQRDDLAEVERLKDKIQDLQTKQQSQPVDKRVLSLANMNKRNRSENFKTAFKAVNKANASVGEAGHDPFSRRWTRSQNYYKAPVKLSSNLTAGELAEVSKAVKGAALSKAIEEGQGAEAVAQLVNAVLESGSDLVDREAPTDGTQLMGKHMFDVQLTLEPLQRWGLPHDAYMTRKRLQEATCGAPTAAPDGRRHALVLTVNDYKRRRGLL